MSQTYVASDLEGTISQGYIWEGMRDFLIQQGRGAAFQRYRRRKMPKAILFRLGLGDKRAFKNDWILGILKLCAGFDQAEVAAMGQFIAENALWPQRRQPVVDELLDHQRQGRKIIVASGHFQPMLESFTALLGDAGAIGTPLAFDAGRLTGEIAGPMNVGPQKAARVRQIVGDGTLLAAYGDTAADIPLLELSQQPVAVFPDKTLRQTAVSRGWRIIESEIIES